MAPCTAADFETTLRAQLHTQFLSQLPPALLKMRVGDFIQLAAVGDKENCDASLSSVEETPKTATRRSTRSTAASTLASITKTVQKRLFPFATANVISTPAPQTPHLTIKSGASVAKPQLSVMRGGNTSVMRTSVHTQSTTKVQNLPLKTPSRRAAVSETPRAATNPPATPSGGIVQFQLDDGKVIDVDFSRSPKSALQEANLLGSEAIGEVKAKIENYANQFMQYLKFFKKFKPT